MPALDRDHYIVRHALEKEGWTITHDPLRLEIDDDDLYVDLGAERVIAADKGTRKIAVEIKMFAGPSKIADLQGAIGQYILYRVALRKLEPERELYLAVPQTTLKNRFQKRELWSAFLTEEQCKIFGYDTENEEITEWLP